MNSAGLVSILTALILPLPREIHGPQNWPIERIVENLQARVAENPNDAEAHYNLGRAHGFAFALERSALWVSAGKGDRVYVKSLSEQGTRKEAVEFQPKAMVAHLEAGVAHLRRATELKDERASVNAARSLTFAWLLETGAHLSDQVDTLRVFDLRAEPLASGEREEAVRAIDSLGVRDRADAARRYLSDSAMLERILPLICLSTASSNAARQQAVRELIQGYWRNRAIEAYWDAVQHSLDSATGQPRATFRYPDRNEMLIYEALDGYRRLVEARGIVEADQPRLAELARIEKDVDALPISGGFVTPIVVSLDSSRGLNELVRLDHLVQFDLDGDCNAESWPWLAPDAGWLVWDPMREAHITSGRQLFGSASAWLFFEDGYRVLDALDDDRDRRLTGVELSGLSVWFDRDSDGVSHPKEVIPVDRLGVVALATRATESIGVSLANPCGLELADGRVLPTYDWVVAPVSE